MNRRICAAISSIAVVTSASGQVLSATVDILSPGDEGYEGIPDRLLVLDVFVDIAETDVWRLAGFRASTRQGAEFQYFDYDPNSPNEELGLVNPGLENRFMTSLSRPRARNGNGRFLNGAVRVEGGFDGPAAPVLTSSLLNVAYDAFPSNPDSPSVDGWIARIAAGRGQHAARRRDCGVRAGHRVVGICVRDV